MIVIPYVPQYVDDVRQICLAAARSGDAEKNAFRC